MSNNYLKHFKTEWEFLIKRVDESAKEVLEDFKPMFEMACEIFDKQDHSGFSAHFFAPKIAKILENVLLFRTLTTFSKDEDFLWNEIAENTWQSSRDSRIFKDKNGIKFLDAIVWKQRKTYFTGTLKNGLSSTLYIKKLPFYPVTFYIEIDEEENIINKDELKKVVEIYEVNEKLMNF